MSQWKEYRIKDVARLISEKATDNSLPYIALDNIISWDARFVSSDSTSDGNSNVCFKNDVLFGKLRPYLAKGYIPTEDSICSPEFIVLRPNDFTNNKFLLYFLLSRHFIDYIRNQVTGVKMPRTNAIQVGGTLIKLPPFVEQKVIAAYLDKECAKIERKIELLERKADAYTRLRRSLINHAVTLNWNSTRRIKDVFCIIGGNGFKESLQGKTKGEYPFLKTSDINSNSVYINSAANYVDKDDVDFHKFSIVPVNSIICSKIGAALKLNHRKLTQKEVVIDNNLQALVPNVGFLPKYCYYVLSVLDMAMFDNLGAIPCINNKLLRNYHISFPSIIEQQQITAYLDEKCGKIDAIMKKISNKIERLKELKRSLINEVVTGQRAIKNI